MKSCSIKSASILFFLSVTTLLFCSCFLPSAVQTPTQSSPELVWLPMGPIAQIHLQQLRNNELWYFCHFVITSFLSVTHLSCRNIVSGYMTSVLNCCKTVVSQMSNQAYNSFNPWYICAIICVDQNQPHLLVFSFKPQ